jgi:predicted nucleotidyltransferase
MNADADNANADANHHGIAEFSYSQIIGAVEAFPEIERVVLFGSRAMGNAKTGSDIDLAIYGHKVTRETASRLSAELNEHRPIPYYVDILVYAEMSHEGLKRHIDEHGRELYRRHPVDEEQ